MVANNGMLTNLRLMPNSRAPTDLSAGGHLCGGMNHHAVSEIHLDNSDRVASRSTTFCRLALQTANCLVLGFHIVTLPILISVFFLRVPEILAAALPEILPGQNRGNSGERQRQRGGLRVGRESDPRSAFKTTSLHGLVDTRNIGRV